jgi:prolyl-tRNA editing enzyme YbaK/EbsC (Cys-tRNA(Pro) deacylase)
VTGLSHPAIQRVVGAASRRGVDLDIRLLPNSPRSAEEAAIALGTDVGQIVRSLVFVAPGPGNRLLAVVCLTSARHEVDLGLLSAVTGEFAIRPATERETSSLTGCIGSGVPPIGHDRDVRTVMDQDLSAHQWVWAAAGVDRALFRVAPATLRMLSNAVVAPLAGSSRTRPPGYVGAEPALQPATGSGAA